MNFLNFQQYLQPLIDFLHIHPHFAGIITFFVVFFEAMAVVGVIVPGSITMTAIGILIGSNIIPAGSTFLWGIAGAILGDYLSYVLGVYYQNRLHRMWPFKKYPQLLDKSEEFFHKHGGKSVFIGRFFGPMRAMVPMVAGMLKMSRGRFLIAAIPSAAMWAVMYMLPGVLLGALSLELPPKIATQFILGAFAVLLFLWTITWLVQHFARRVYRWLDSYIMRSWNFMTTHKSLSWLPKILHDPHEPGNHQQLSLLILLFIVCAFFIVILVNVLFQWNLTILNRPMYYFISSLRTPFFDRLMVPITFLGQDSVLLISSSLFGLWLIYKRYWYVALHWLLLMFFCAWGAFQVKHLVFSSRPEEALSFLHDSSFPSGHTALSTAMYGFWAVLVAREIQASRRWIVYASVSVVIASIALSRLYLGVHWLTDIVGGLMLGLSTVLLFTLSYRRLHSVSFSLRNFILLSMGILFFVWVSYSALFLNKHLAGYSLKWPEKTITMKDWQEHIDNSSVPLYRVNRVGIPAQAFNLEWLGDIGKIESNLLKKGWEKQPTEINWYELAQHLVGDNIASHLPLLNQLYHNRSVVLLMTKESTGFIKC